MNCKLTWEYLVVNHTGEVRDWVRMKLIESENVASSTYPIRNLERGDWQNATVVDVETVASEVVDNKPESLWRKVNRWFKTASDILWPAI